MERIRIRLLGGHIGYVPKHLYEEVEHFNEWLKNEVYETFHLQLLCTEDLERLEQRVIEEDYENIADWIRECLRNRKHRRQLVSTDALAGDIQRQELILSEAKKWRTFIAKHPNYETLEQDYHQLQKEHHDLKQKLQQLHYFFNTLIKEDLG